MLITVVMAPALLKLSQAVRRSGALQGPVLALVSFFQTADLFKHLDLNWPPAFKKFIQQFAQYFNFQLPNLPFIVHPECGFSLTYSQKWLLELARCAQMNPCTLFKHAVI